LTNDYTIIYIKTISKPKRPPQQCETHRTSTLLILTSFESSQWAQQNLQLLQQSIQRTQRGQSRKIFEKEELLFYIKENFIFFR